MGRNTEAKLQRLASFYSIWDEGSSNTLIIGGSKASSSTRTSSTG
jgi:hypothetical protein